MEASYETPMTVQQLVPKLLAKVPDEAAQVVQMLYGRTASRRLNGIKAARKLLSDFEVQVVADARTKDKMTWKQIGHALGKSEQMVNRQYGQRAFLGHEPKLKATQEVTWPEDSDEEPTEAI
jgi:hypothetical protein